jgi:tetratricopeptide (TPR) repeat protein
MSRGVLGRETELAAVAALLDEPAPGALVLTGGPGIGKTTLWRAGIAAALERGHRVLAAQATDAVAQLSFAALTDLCHDVGDEAFEEIPAPQLAALEVALLRAAPADAPPEPRAIALGFTALMRTLASEQPLVIAIDDLQWLDDASADAIAYAAWRLGDVPVRFLLARRPVEPTQVERSLTRLERLEVGPLSLVATRRLLSERLDLALSRHHIRRIVEATLGNPLFALEIGRALGDRVDLPLPHALEDMLGTRVAELPDPLRRVLLAVALGPDLTTGELATIADAVDEAVAAGLVVIDRDRVRASHPLLAEAAKQRARSSERRAVHRALADVVAGAELRALHLALAADRADPVLAGTAAAAAATASARGARHEAVRLAEHALRLTPEDAPEWTARLLELAHALEIAGEADRLSELLKPVVNVLPSGPVRAEAYVLLSEGGHIRTFAEYDHYLDLALVECGDDPVLRADILAKKSVDASASRLATMGVAETLARDALEAAERAGPESERLGLMALAWVRAMTGHAIDDICERHRTASDAAVYIVEDPGRIAGQRLVWRGEIAPARALLGRLLALADERGEANSYAIMRLHVTELELRAGHWDAAERLLDEWAESADADLLIPPMYERCRALLHAGRGEADPAEQWAAKTIADARAVGILWDEQEALRARTQAALLEDDPARAAESARAVWEHMTRDGVTEPGVYPIAPDLVEALTRLGELDEARTVTDRLRDLAEQHAHPWARLSVRRSLALIRLAAAYDEAATDELAAVANAYGVLGLRFDAARTHLAAGRAQRRHRKWAGATASLERARDAFSALGSPGWEAQTGGSVMMV